MAGGAAGLTWMQRFLATYFPSFWRENAEAVRARVAEVEREAPAMEELLACPGWQVLEARAAEMQARRSALLMGGDGTSDERLRGEHAGIGLVMGYPARVVADAKRFAEGTDSQ